MNISNEYAAELIEGIRADIESRDELTGAEPVNPRDHLMVKLWDDLQALTKAMSFMGGGIRPVQRVQG